MASKTKYFPKPGKVNTPLQQLASKRNWDRLQIKGSLGQLRHQLLNSAINLETKTSYTLLLSDLEEALLLSLDKRWAVEKVAFAKAVAREAFDVEIKPKKIKEVKEPLPSSGLEADTKAVVAKNAAKRAKIKQGQDEF